MSANLFGVKDSMQARPQTYAQSDATESLDPPRDRPVQKNIAKIAIADKNPIVRAGLSDYIKRDDRFDIREMVSSGAEFIALCERTKIDVAARQDRKYPPNHAQVDHGELAQGEEFSNA